MIVIIRRSESKPQMRQVYEKYPCHYKNNNETVDFRIPEKEVNAHLRQDEGEVLEDLNTIIRKVEAA